ncbi:MAG: glycosyltransferase [Magnetococcales bacterium]|nr:glycosyltransferase [Magnetococcales bacterium]
MTQKRILLVFGKYPRVGHVKTRLAPAIGFPAAQQLYKAFLSDAACRFIPPREGHCYDVKWVYSPKDSDFPQMIRSMHSLCGFEEKKIDASLDSILFSGHDIDDIGEMQINQLKWARNSGYESVIIIGTDSPHHSKDTISKAFERLEDNDVVIGPSTDGGYYLLGLRNIWDIIDGIDMSSRHVINNLVARANAANRRVGYVETITDIDDWDDLQVLIKKISPSHGEPCRNTWKTLKKLGLAE